MEYTYLGRTGMKVSRLCLGTGAFSGVVARKGEYGSVDEKTAYEIMDAALDAGINFFDTANVYGGSMEARGYTEELIGRWFAKGGNRRQRVILGSKVGRAFEKDEIYGPNKDQGLSLYKIRRHLKDSLRRLQTDHIELYQMHYVDRNVQWDELWEAFEGVVRQGFVDYIGSCNFAARDLLNAQAEAKDRKFMGLVSEQLGYNLLNRFPELEILPTAKQLGIGITVFSPLARGLLAHDVTRSANCALSADAERLLGRNREKMEKYSALCKSIGAKESHVALAWLLANPAVTSPVIGPCSVEELEDSLQALELKLDDETLRRLDEIFIAPKEVSMFN